MAPIAIGAMLDSIASHAMSLGLFERVQTHEPKNAPGHGLTCAIWADRITAALGQSGLASTSAYIVFNIRIMASFLLEPQDAIDPNMVNAVDVLFGEYSGDFDLGSTARNIDLLGAQGIPLQANAGYLTQDGKVFRVMTIMLPVIVNDVWDQVV